MNDFAPDQDARRIGMAFERERHAAGVPAIALDFSTHWCPRHLEPFRAGWPAKAGLAMVMLFEAFTADERVGKLTGGDAMRLAAVALEWSPLCCFVGDDALAPIYLELGKRAPARRVA